MYIQSQSISNEVIRAFAPENLSSGNARIQEVLSEGVQL